MAKVSFEYTLLSLRCLDVYGKLLGVDDGFNPETTLCIPSRIVFCTNSQLHRMRIFGVNKVDFSQPPDYHE